MGGAGIPVELLQRELWDLKLAALDEKRRLILDWGSVLVDADVPAVFRGAELAVDVVGV
jgi:hypothetical protein